MIIHNGQAQNPKPADEQCICCQKLQGTYKYGIYVCGDCDFRIFIKPYGSYSMDPDVHISSVSLKIDASETEYDELQAIYRFSQNDTLISARIGTLSFPVLVIPSVMPLTQEFLDKVPKQLKIWLTFS